MRNISAWAIKHPIIPIVLFVVLTVVGIVSFLRLPINHNPDIDYPIVSVNISFPGAAPSEIESQILQKVEGSVAGIGNVRSIESVASEGSSETDIEFQIGTPIDRAVTDVRDAVTKVRADLPQGILEPQVARVQVAGGPIAFFAITTTALSEQELSWFIDNAVTKRLLAIPGVSQVNRVGGVDRQMRVDLDPARMQALGLTAAQVNEQLRDLNLNAPGGRAQVGGGEQTIRVLGSARSALNLADVQITLPGGGNARLGDFAVVSDSFGNGENLGVLSMAEFQGCLYVGTTNGQGAEVHCSQDGVNWKLSYKAAGDPQREWHAWKLHVFANRLYLGLGRLEHVWWSGFRLVSTADGHTWIDDLDLLDRYHLDHRQRFGIHYATS